MIAPLSPNAATRGFTSHSGSCTVDCNGAQMRAHCQDQVTVVKVTGDIDAVNIDRFYDYTRRFVGEAPGLMTHRGNALGHCRQPNCQKAPAHR